jgi:hypothetical protein
LSDGPAPYYKFPIAADRQPASYNGQGIGYNPYHKNFGFVQEWRFDVQRALGRSTVVDVAYVGLHGNDNPFTRSINQVPENLLYNAASGVNMNQFRPFPTFLSINANLNDGTSTYRALQISLKKEFSSGMSFIGNYTFSRTMDNGSSTGGNGAVGIDAIQNDYDLNANWGRAVNDTPSVASGGIVYPLPFGMGKRFLNEGGLIDSIVGGWRVSSILMFHSGLPFTPEVGTANLSGAQDGNWYPNLVGNPAVAHRTAQEWFNPAAYAIPAIGTFGDSTRNSLRGPGMEQVDASVSKSFRISLLGEGSSFELKADAFNVFNHTNLLNPNASIGTASAGVISSAQSARNLQFGGRLVF